MKSDLTLIGEDIFIGLLFANFNLPGRKYNQLGTHNSIKCSCTYLREASISSIGEQVQIIKSLPILNTLEMKL